MLTHLFVSNYALIDRLSLDFSTGLTILTGETGAGKSILLGALRLVLGERADIKAVKDASKKCVIEAQFDISKLSLENFFEINDLDYDTHSIFRREILPSGKSRAFINDVPVTIKVLDKLGKALIDIHSQFQTAELLADKFQFEWIDAVANQEGLVREFQTLLVDFRHKKHKLNQLVQQKEDFQKEVDYYTFLSDELNNADLDSVSIEALEQEHYALEHADEIAQSIGEIIQLLDNEEFGVFKVLNEILMKAKVLDLDKDKELFERIEGLNIETKDISNELTDRLDTIEINPERLLQVQEKLNQINLLLQKHNVQEISGLIEIRNELDEKLLANLDTESLIEKVKKETQSLEKELKKKADTLHSKRLEVIPIIQDEIIQSLYKLGMPDAKLEIRNQKVEVINDYGMSQIQLLFSANKGMAPREISKSVSGGERSRLMLAIKESVAKHKELPTLILDEIDTGVSGKVAGSMGEIMSDAAKHLQIIAITHLPQVAAYAQQHLKVFKKDIEGITTSSVEVLSEDERILELAQMLSGKEVSDAAILQAKELIRQS